MFGAEMGNIVAWIGRFLKCYVFSYVFEHLVPSLLVLFGKFVGPLEGRWDLAGGSGSLWVGRWFIALSYSQTFLCLLPELLGYETNSYLMFPLPQRCLVLASPT